MKTNVQSGLEELAEGLNALMADLEDLRDELQDSLEEREDGEVRSQIQRMDQALRLLAQAADVLDEDA